MKIIITENRLVNLVSKLIDSKYGDLEMVEDDNEINWFNKDGEKIFFGRKDSGTLWIPESLVGNIVNYLQIEDVNFFDEIFKKIWAENWGLIPKKINIYF